MTCAVDTFHAVQLHDELLLEVGHPAGAATVDPDVLEPQRRPQTFEWRRGESWAYGVPLGRTKSPHLVTRDFGVGTEPYYVRTINEDDGTYSARANEISVTTVAPQAWSSASTRDETTVDGGWPGSMNETQEAVGGELELAASSLEGTYESPQFDLGELAVWQMGYTCLAEFDDPDRTIASLDPLITSLTFPPTDARANQSLHELAPDAESVWALENDAVDNIYNPQSCWRLDWTIYTTDGVPGTYHTAVGANYYGRYAKFRLTLKRDVATVDLKIATMKIHWSQPSSGGGGGASAPSDWLDITLPPYNATPNDNSAAVATANHTAIQQAIDDAYALSGGRNGGVIYAPAGEFFVDDEFELKNYCRFIGANSRATVISCHSNFPNTGATVFNLGDPTAGAGGIVFGCRLENLTIDCKQIANTVAVFSNKAQEESGLFNVTITNCGAHGIKMDNSGASSASQVVIDTVDIGTQVSGAIGIEMSGVAGENTIKHCTIQGDPAGPTYLTDGILISGTDVRIIGIHFETCIDGIDFSGSGRVETIYGHSTVTNLVHLRSPTTLFSMAHISSASSTNTLVDDNEGVTYTSGALGHIIEYNQTLFMHGPLEVRRRAQSSAQDKVYFPDCNGVDIELAHIQDGASIGTNRLVVGAGAPASRFKQVPNSGFSMLDLDGSHQVNVAPPALTAVTHASPYTINLPREEAGTGLSSIDLVGTNSTDQLRFKTLVDQVVMRNGQTDRFVTLSSQDQTVDDATASFPDMAGVDRNIMLAELSDPNDLARVSGLGASATVDLSGSDNQVLTIDGSGNCAFEDAQAAPLTVVAKTAAYTVVNADDVIYCDSAPWTLSLLAVADRTKNRPIYVKNNDGGGSSITIDPDGSEQIEGNPTYSLGSGENVTIRKTAAGTAWEVW